MNSKNIINEYGMTSGAPTPVTAQQTGSVSKQTSVSPSKVKSASPSTVRPASPTDNRGTTKPAMLSLPAQNVPVNSVVKRKDGKVMGTVVEPIEKTSNKALPLKAPAGKKADAVVIKDPQGKYKVVKGKDALIIDDPRVQQESVTKSKLTLENIVTVNNRNYGNSLRISHIEQLPLEEQLILLDKIDTALLNETYSKFTESQNTPTGGGVPDNNKVRMINKLLAKPFPANDIKGQMDAFFAIPDPGMIKAFRQVRAEDGDKASLHTVLRQFVKTMHPAIQKSIKLNETRLDEADDINQVKQAVIQGVRNIDTAAKDANIAKKNAALIDKLYTELNKGSVLDRISGVMPDMLKGEYPERMIADIVQQLASAPLTYIERSHFSDNLANDKVINTKILLTPGIHTIDELTYNDPINRTVFDHMKTYGLNQQMKGPGEHALAILSKNISLQGKGDISVNGIPVEIKAAVGSSANALGGRFGEGIGLPTREQIISEISKYPAMKQLLDQHLAKQKSLNVIGFTVMANNAGLKPAERAKLAKGIFGAIFGTSASLVISAFNTPQADPEAVRLAYIEDNFDWYKNGKQGGSWEVLAGLNFSGNSIGVLKTGSDIAKVPSIRSTPYIITTGKPQEMLYQFTPKAL